jgi:BirA family biotin operon repressor/biotin-[acetyl-CoA-carboxylase] ligase
VTQKSGGKPGKRIAAWERRIDADFARLSPGTLWHTRCFESTSSTMEAARDLAPQVSVDGAGVVLARAQSEGRGRQGRPWVSPADGFFATYVLASAKEAQAAGGFSLAAGVAVRTVLAGLGADVWLKWPNDILSSDGAKIGGILIEIAAEAGKTSLLCGIGINLLDAPRIPERDAPTGSLAAAGGRKISPEELAAPLGAELLGVWRRVLESGFAPIREAWMRGALFLGERLSVDCGGEVVSGTFVEVDSSGRLVLDGPSGRRRIVAGHVLLQR